MKIEKISIEKLKINPENPRTIIEPKFKKLVQSITDFPQMLQIRPIVINEDMVVLGGNMRLRACEEAGLKEVYIIRAKDLTKEQQDEFIIKDNVPFGEWDWDSLANNWGQDNLSNWGLHTINLGELHKMDSLNENKEWVGMPEFDVSESPIKVIINFENETDRDEFQKIYDFQYIKKQEKAWSTWFPYKERQDLKNLKYE